MTLNPTQENGQTHSSNSSATIKGKYKEKEKPYKEQYLKLRMSNKLFVSMLLYRKVIELSGVKKSVLCK